MGNSAATVSAPGRRHTLTLPPPVLGWAREVEALEAAGTELGVVLWRVLRRVRAWAETAREERAALFEIDKREARERLGQGCVHAPELVEAFGVFAQLIRAPERMEARQLADACHEVHAWAEEHSLLKVAMLFAEAGATADPDDPARANQAGTMCRRAAFDDRAASWYHRASGLAVRYKARQEIIRAQLGYGNLMKELGEHDEARKYFERAAQRAISTGRERQAAEAFHDLLAISAEAGTYSEAERYVRRALSLYPIHHPRLPVLAHDWAFLLVRSRFYTPAIPLLEMASSRARTPEFDALFKSTLAWAVAGAGRQDQFEAVEQAVNQLLLRPHEYTAAALNHLGEGARVLGLWDRAEQYAATAVEVAATRKDVVIQRESSTLVDKIVGRELGPLEEVPSNRERLDSLRMRIEARLRQWDTPGRTGPGAIPQSAKSLPVRGGL